MDCLGLLTCNYLITKQTKMVLMRNADPRYQDSYAKDDFNTFDLISLTFNLSTSKT